MAALLRKVMRSVYDKVPTDDLCTSNSSVALPCLSTGSKEPHPNNDRKNGSVKGLVSRFQQSIRVLEQDDQSTSLLDIRNKLARKASTLSLRSKHRRSVLRRGGEQTPRAHTFLAFEKDVQVYKSERNNERSTPPVTVITDTDSAPPPPPIKKREYTSLSSTSLAASFPADKALHKRTGFKSEEKDESSFLRQYQNVRERYWSKRVESDTNVTWIKMASEQAAPPVSYERLRQVTTEACDTTLSSVKAYSHVDTEAWNTQIINSILATLVKGSASSANGPASQSSFKFVVNSTIIQHASGSTAAGDDTTKSVGRRGMHSASGAYWNNEKDGMWSFKYEAAEAKGLDVVVGIIWIWVG